MQMSLEKPAQPLAWGRCLKDAVSFPASVLHGSMFAQRAKAEMLIISNLQISTWHVPESREG
jgi:hypothetical protein